MKYVLVGALALLTGCATVTRGTTQAWTVESDPIGASVRLSSGETCTTPCTLKKKRKHGFSVVIEKDGYEQVLTSVVSSIGGGGAAGLAGNVLIGGLIGIGVDAGTGAANDLKPNPLVVRLNPKVAAPIDAAPAAPAAVAEEGERP